MKGETFRQSAQHKRQDTKQAETTHLITFKGRRRWKEFQVGKYSTTQHRRERWRTGDASEEANEWGATFQTREMKLQKPEKRALKYEWFVGLQRWLCETHAHPEPWCQKQQTGLEKYWSQSVPALTLNKAISTSLKHGCSIRRGLALEAWTSVVVVFCVCRIFFFLFLLIVLYFLPDGCGILAYKCVPDKYDSADPLIHRSSGNKGARC